LARQTLDEFGFDSMELRLVYHQWMGQFPMQRERAAALIAGSALVAGIIGADKIVVKTVDEALGVPRPEVNAEAVDTVRYVLRSFSSPEAIDSPAIEMESNLLESEARSILGAIFDLSGEAFWESVYRAFQLGYLDLPFSPHADNANLLLSMRDANRSIRIVDPGRVPVSAADAAAERRLLASRADRSEKTYRQMLSDIGLMA
jgi:methylaspartate mutase epsilon subunit